MEEELGGLDEELGQPEMPQEEAREEDGREEERREELLEEGEDSELGRDLDEMGSEEKLLGELGGAMLLMGGGEEMGG